jgi:hypothetical protein
MKWSYIEFLILGAFVIVCLIALWGTITFNVQGGY